MLSSRRWTCRICGPTGPYGTTSVANTACCSTEKARLRGRKMAEPFWRGAKQRVLQEIARSAPGATTLRPRLHRARGVTIGANVWIGYDVVLDTSSPELIT